MISLPGCAACCAGPSRLEVLLHFLAVRENLFEALLEPVDIVVDQVLPMDLVLID